MEIQQQGHPFIDYLSQLNNYSRPVKRLQDLSDGLIVYQIMMKVRYFQSEGRFTINDQPVTFVHCLSNLKLIMKSMERFWTRYQRKQPCAQKQIDLVRIAKNKDEQQITKFLSLFVRTLFSSQESQKYIQKMLQTNQKTQQFFMKIVQESLQESQTLKSPTVKTNINLYDKILELEHQNQRLLALLNQACLQKQQGKQKQIQLQQKLDQMQSQVKRLTWKMDQLANSRKQAHDCLSQDSLLCLQEKRANENLTRDLEQRQQRQRTLISNLQRQRSTTQNQLRRIQSLSLVHNQYKFQQEQNVKLHLQTQTLEDRIQKLQRDLAAKASQIMLFKDATALKDDLIQQLSAKLQSNSEQFILKQQLIEQLQDNIKYLTQPQKCQQSEQKQPRTSIKQECKQLLSQYPTKASQSAMIQLRRQVQKLSQQLQDRDTQAQRQQMCIERLKNFQEENKKLIQMIDHMNRYRGEENQILVKCLYKMRVKMLGMKGQSSIKCHKQKPLQEVVNRNF